MERLSYPSRTDLATSPFSPRPDCTCHPRATRRHIALSAHPSHLRYLERPDLTGKKFVPRPPTISAIPVLQTPGQDARDPALYSRLYDTGDWGRLRPDGGLEILGRHDSMQKIRGYAHTCTCTCTCTCLRAGRGGGKTLRF